MGPPQKDAFPSPRISSIVTELLGNHGTTTAMTIHLNLLNDFSILIETNKCHDLMTLI
jgi:hypothetical protein